MLLDGIVIRWCSSDSYLLSGRSIKFDIVSCKRAFYSACNCIFMYGSDVDALVLLSLQESYEFHCSVASIVCLVI